MENNNNNTMYEWLDNMTGGFCPRWINLNDNDILTLSESYSKNNNPVEYMGVVIDKNTGEKNSIIKLEGIDKTIINDATLGNVSPIMEDRRYLVINADDVDEALTTLTSEDILVDGPYKSIDEACRIEHVYQASIYDDTGVELNWTQKSEKITNALREIIEDGYNK